jgi:hypothetical protein
MRRAREDHDDDKEEGAGGFPLMVRLAAIAWIGFGCLIIVNALAGAVLNIAVMVTTPPRPAARLAPPRPGQPIVNAPAGFDADMRMGIETGVRIFLAMAISGSLVFAGVQTLRGAAKDTLGNAIGAIVLGVLNLGCGGVLIVAGFGLGGLGTVVAIAIGALGVAVGLGLAGTAILALVGRTQYLSWRRAQRRRR